MEALPQLSQKEIFTHQQIKLIGISIDENREDWEKFSIQYPLEWVNIHAAGSFDSEIATDYNLFATPLMFFDRRKSQDYRQTDYDRGIGEKHKGTDRKNNIAVR